MKLSCNKCKRFTIHHRHTLSHVHPNVNPVRKGVMAIGRFLPSGETKWSRPMASTLYYSKALRTHSSAIQGDKVVSPDGLHFLRRFVSFRVFSRFVFVRLSKPGSLFAVQGDKVISPDGLHSLLLQGSNDSLLPSRETKGSRLMASTLYYSKAPRNLSFAI